MAGSGKETVAVGLAGLGGFLVWVAVTGRDPRAAILSAFGGPPAPRAVSSPSRAGSVADSSATVPSGLRNPITTTRPITYPSHAGSVANAAKTLGAPGGIGDQGQALVYIGQGSHRLTAEAAAALGVASSTLGRQILVTDSYRSHAQQVAVAAAKPGLAATPGKSWHEKAKAIDTAVTNDAQSAALSAAGWARFSPGHEPWHWSYGGIG